MAQPSAWFTSDYDIPSNLITQVFCDSRGMVWGATQDGLARFDGSKFKIFRHNDNDTTSILSNVIDCIMEDSKGNIWVVSYDGIQRFDYNTDSFSAAGKNQNGSVINGLINIFERKNGQLISLGHVPRIISYDEHGVITVSNAALPEELALSSSIVEDNNGCLWVSQTSKGVARMDTDSKIRRYNSNGDKFVIQSLAKDANGRIFAGCQHSGLYVYDSVSDSFRIASNDFAGMSIKNIYDNGDGTLMVCTDRDGLYKFNTSTSKVTLVKIGGIDSQHAKVHTFARDKFGNMWMGIYHKGIYMQPAAGGAFKSVTTAFSNYGTCVCAITEDHDGNFWVSTDNDGIYRLDRDMNIQKHFSGNIPATVTGLAEDKFGTLWVSTFGAGTGTMDKNNGRFSPFNIIDSDGNIAKNSFGLIKDNLGNIIVSTLGNGLFEINPGTKEAKQLKSERSTYRWIPSISHTRKSNSLLIGFFDGAIIKNLDTEEEYRIKCDKIILSMVETPDGTIWGASQQGLVKISRNGKLERIYTDQDGLPTSAIYAIAEGNGYVWAATGKGIARLNPEDNSFTNYTIADGIQGNEFVRNAVFTATDGTIYFGGTNGLTYFNPADNLPTPSKRNVKLTDFFIRDVPVRENFKSGGKKVIDGAVYDAEEFSIAHSDNTFTVEFTSDNPKGSASLEYYYSFDGDKWQKVEPAISSSSVGGVRITLHRCTPGTHSLSMKIIDNGIESDIRTVKITVRPDWYQTWWAKILYSLLFFSAIGAIVAYRLRELKRKRDAEQYAQKEQLSESRIHFLVNISHDIRTPLTLIIDPLKRLLEADTDDTTRNSLRMMLRNANRIMKMTDEVMDLRKLDNDKMRLKPAEINASDFISDVVDLFRTHAENKGITLEFDHEGYDDLHFYADYNCFDKILLNLISNAIKYTGKGGKVKITLSVDNGKVVIRISDTGCGIPDDQKDKIFDRFFQASNHAGGGTGIGLHISRAFVKLHHGEITVADNTEADTGTVFTIVMPIIPDGTNLSLKSDDHAITHTRIGDTAELYTATGPLETNATKGKHLIYIVEDDDEIRAYLSQEIGKHYKTKLFSNGKEAMDAASRNRPDLIITDIMMPVMDGYELTAAIKGNVQMNTIPVILLTAKNLDEDRIKGLEANADAYLAKPFDMNVLLTQIKVLLGNYTRLKNAFSGNQNQERHVEKIEIESNDDKLMNRFMNVINKNIDDPELTVEAIADEVGISRVHLYRKIKDLTNQTPRDFLRNYRLQRAAELLAEQKLNVSQICDTVGFSSISTFSTAFKKLYGMAPSEYASRRKQSEDNFIG